jgi:hypothetical protein
MSTPVPDASRSGRAFGRSTCVRFVAILCAAVSSACGARLMKLPSGPGAPASDGVQALAQATAACGAIRTLTAELRVSGSVGGRRVRARLSAGLATPASARLEAMTPFGPPLFVFACTGDSATLWLPRDDRFVADARASDVLEAVAGVPLGGAELRETFTGCAPLGSAPSRARQVGDSWRVVPTDEGGEVYLRRDPSDGPWRIVAEIRRLPSSQAWLSEYRDFQDGLPHSVRLASLQASRFDLQVSLTQVEANTTLEQDAFRVQIPDSARPMTLDELRASGPLAAPPR